VPALLPAIFFGHGNPMNAVQNNGYTAAWRQFGQTISKPKAMLLRGCAVCKPDELRSTVLCPSAKTK
jgi:hypothetical protein